VVLQLKKLGIDDLVRGAWWLCVCARVCVCACVCLCVRACPSCLGSLVLQLWELGPDSLVRGVAGAFGLLLMA